jgi:hypothetical protein
MDCSTYGVAISSYKALVILIMDETHGRFSGSGGRNRVERSAQWFVFAALHDKILARLAGGAGAEASGAARKAVPTAGPAMRRTEPDQSIRPGISVRSPAAIAADAPSPPGHYQHLKGLIGQPTL